MSARLLAILPRGEAIRNFVWHDGLQGGSHPFDVFLQSVRPSEDIWKMLQARFTKVAEIVNDPTPPLVSRVRELLWSVHNADLDNEASRYRVRSHRSQAGSRLGRAKVECWRALGLMCAPIGVERLASIERRMSRRLDRSTHAPRVLDEFDPDVVFNGSEVHSDNAISVMQVAGWRGIPTATFLFSWDNLTSQRRLLVPASRYLVWNDAIQSQLLAMYPSINRGQVVVTGSPQFDPHMRRDTAMSRSELCDAYRLDPMRPIVLYTSGMPNHMPGEQELVSVIQSEIMRRFGSHGPQLVVRVYAKDRTGRFDYLRHECSEIRFVDPIWESNWFTPMPQDTALWTSLLMHADVGINVASTVSLELCMFDKPVINVAFNPPGIPDFPVRYKSYYSFDHYRPVVESGAVAVVESLPALIDELVAVLRSPGDRSTWRRNLVEEMFGSTLDGRSGERIVSALAELVG